MPSEDLWRVRAETIEAAILRGLAEFLRDPVLLMTTLDVDRLAIADLQTMNEGASALAARLLSSDGRPELHRDIAWVRRVSADIEALRTAYPETGWHTFEEWVQAQDWSILDRERATANPCAINPGWSDAEVVGD